MSTPISIWLDCDTGHDDAFAILLAAYNPKVKLLGISTVYGNASLSNTTYNTLAILKAIGREDIPVYAGASKPFCREPASAPDIHGESGLDGTTCLPAPTQESVITNTAVEAMYNALIATTKETSWLVLTGALTNSALLFAIHPDLAEHLAGVSIMGGAIGGGFTDAPLGALAGEGERFGNWTPWAEFNIYLDPESAHSVLIHPVIRTKTTLIPLDLTHQFIATVDVQQTALHGHNHTVDGTDQVSLPTVRKLFFEILTFFARTYAEVFGLTDGPPLHDPLAVAAVFAPELFSDNGGERFEVTVITEGEHGSAEHVRSGSSECGRTVAEKLPLGTPGVRIPRGLEVNKVWKMLDRCLTQASVGI